MENNKKIENEANELDYNTALNWLESLAIRNEKNEIELTWIKSLKKNVKNYIDSLENDLKNLKNKSMI